MVLPAPLGPSRATISPARTRKSTPRSARMSAIVFVYAFEAGDDGMRIRVGNAVEPMLGCGVLVVSMVAIILQSSRGLALLAGIALRLSLPVMASSRKAEERTSAIHHATGVTNVIRDMAGV